MKCEKREIEPRFEYHLILTQDEAEMLRLVAMYDYAIPSEMMRTGNSKFSQHRLTEFLRGLQLVGLPHVGLLRA